MNNPTTPGTYIDPSWIKRSDWPANVIPAGAEAFAQTDEAGDCTVMGFYDPASGEIHIQGFEVRT